MAAPVQVVCPHCGKTINLTRDTKGRWIVSIGGFTLGAVIGGVIGATIGLATGGWGIPATVPLGAAMGAILSGSGYIIADKLIDKFRCPACGQDINI